MTCEKAPFLQCRSCSEKFSLKNLIWKCSCGGVLDVKGTKILPKDQLAQRPPNFWRYRESLGLTSDVPHVSLGEVITPLLRARFRGWDITLKLEYVLPTGSYKDRGVAICMSLASALGVHAIAEDSSGNAGASTAAYAAAAGIQANIYVPEGTSPAKINQIQIYGAQCHPVPGTRTESAREAQKPYQGVHYIGHSWNPFFACGIKSVAYEIAEQTNWHPPDWVVTPLGGGSLVLGLISGFEELLDAGYIERVPRILAVQSSACAPIWQAWKRNDAEVIGVEKQHTYAEGVALPNPPRGSQVLQAIRSNDGVILAIDDTDLLSCWRDLGRIGISVEPTSAIAVAGAWFAREVSGLIHAGEHVVVLITGHGLKTSPSLMKDVLTR